MPCPLIGWLIDWLIDWPMFDVRKGHVPCPRGRRGVRRGRSEDGTGERTMAHVAPSFRGEMKAVGVPGVAAARTRAAARGASKQLFAVAARLCAATLGIFGQPSAVFLDWHE